MKIQVGSTVRFYGGIPEEIEKALKKLKKANLRDLVLKFFPAYNMGTIGLLDYIGKDRKIEDLRFTGNPVDFGEARTRPDPFQFLAVSKLLERETGYLESPTGSGKTLMALWVMEALGLRTLYITHRVGIAKQVFDLVQFEWRFTPGFVGEGRRKEHDKLVIAVAQSILRKPLEDKFGLIVCDEAHHVSCASLAKVMSDYSAKHRYGMTATLSRSDERAKLFPFILGKHRVVVTPEQARGRLNFPTVVPMYTQLDGARKDFCEKFCKIGGDCEKPLDCKFFQSRMYTFLQAWVNRTDRNNRVESLMERLQWEGVSHTCILTSRKAHAQEIGTRLRGKNTHTTVCVGKLNTDEIDIFKMMGGVLIMTESLAEEGTNIPELQALILVSPAGGKTKVRQRVGRLMRGKGKKRLFDFVDADVFSMRLWWARRSSYRAMGLPFGRI